MKSDDTYDALEEAPVGIHEIKRSWIWLGLLLIAFMPFILRLGLDVNAVNRQAMSKIYQTWLLSPETQSLKASTKELRFERSRDGDVFEDLFVGLLQRDFKVSQSSEVPLIKAYFIKEKNLTARIEWSAPALKHSEPKYFEYRVRFTNNALLLGFWVSLILLFFSLPVARAAVLSLFLMLLWQVRWNPVEIPFHVWNEFQVLWNEFRLDASDSRLWVWWGTLIITLGLFVFRPLLQRFISRHEDRSCVVLMASSFLLEPLLIFAAAHYAQWGEEIFWWKVYVGSLCFRFVSIAFLFSLFRSKQNPEMDSQNFYSVSERLSRQEFIRQLSHRSKSIQWKASTACLLLPLGFLLSGGWEWLNAVLIVDAGWSVLMLKAFLTGLLLAAITGNRLISMLIGLFALATVAAPIEGHWITAAVFGFFLEGLWMGWWVSPMKDWQPLLPLWKHRRSFLVSSFVGWILGIFIYAAGVPLVICWIVVLLGVWSYGQLQDSSRSELVV
jgi:hypothetical protein